MVGENGDDKSVNIENAVGEREGTNKITVSGEAFEGFVKGLGENIAASSVHALGRCLLVRLHAAASDPRSSIATAQKRFDLAETGQLRCRKVRCGTGRKVGARVGAELAQIC